MGIKFWNSVHPKQKGWVVNLSLKEFKLNFLGNLEFTKRLISVVMESQCQKKNKWKEKEKKIEKQWTCAFQETTHIM